MKNLPGLEVDPIKALAFIEELKSRGRNENIDSSMSVVDQLKAAGFQFSEERLKRLRALMNNGKGGPNVQ